MPIEAYSSDLNDFRLLFKDSYLSVGRNYKTPSSSDTCTVYIKMKALVWKLADLCWSVNWRTEQRVWFHRVCLPLL